MTTARKIILIFSVLCMAACGGRSGRNITGLPSANAVADNTDANINGKEKFTDIYEEIIAVVAGDDHIGIEPGALANITRDDFTEYTVADYKLLIFQPDAQLPFVMVLTDDGKNGLIDLLCLPGGRTKNYIVIKEWNGEEHVVITSCFTGQLYESLHEIIYEVNDEGFSEIFSLQLKEISGMFYPEFPVILRERSYNVLDDTVYVDEVKGETNPETDIREEAVITKTLEKTEYSFPLDSIEFYTDRFMIE